ncbi:9683_t:CDS:2 [Diversispora eburnea]|uniref:9683_t:CDS:1 n=1 Tax=Diversispora eburnea TaxID=1213867 RepID=A0A9N8Z165_9GLOM|nr:9683_t:CDS:2 [Diversispora eburnea]
MASIKEIKSCEISLSSPSLNIPTTPNATLSIKGDIRLLLTAPLKVTQAVVKLHGYSQIDNSQKITTRNLTTKDLVKQKITVINIAKTLNAGENSFPFSITIKSPQYLPSSVEGKHAAVRYVLTAELTKANPHAIHKVTKNVILRKNKLLKGEKFDINEKELHEDEREGLLKYKVYVSKYLAIDDDNEEVKVEAFEYEMYNFAKFNSVTGAPPVAKTTATKKPTTTPSTKSRVGVKIPAFSNLSATNPHQTIPLLTPPLVIPVLSEASEPVSFEIPIRSRMKLNANVLFLEIKHEVIMTIRFDKFMLAPLKLEVPIIVIPRDACS